MPRHRRIETVHIPELEEPNHAALAGVPAVDQVHPDCVAHQQPVTVGHARLDPGFGLVLRLPLVGGQRGAVPCRPCRRDLGNGRDGSRDRQGWERPRGNRIGHRQLPRPQDHQHPDGMGEATGRSRSKKKGIGTAPRPKPTSHGSRWRQPATKWWVWPVVASTLPVPGRVKSW